MLNNNYLKIKKEIAKDITIIAVSKNKPVTDIQSLKKIGCLDFGENKVQELLKKYELEPNVRYHFIGHLQSNKVKDIIDKVVLIHSVDSIKLAKKINCEAEKQRVIVPILIQINIGQEETKFGFPINCMDEIVEINQLNNVRIKGLMCIAPNNYENEDNRLYFKQMKKFYDLVNKEIPLEILSMGMSNDYQIAIEEGATMIRIGTKIFGKRI